MEGLFLYISVYVLFECNESQVERSAICACAKDISGRGQKAGSAPSEGIWASVFRFVSFLYYFW